jgi:hypothetical protein
MRKDSFESVNDARHELIRQQAALDVLGAFLRDDARYDDKGDQGKFAYGCGVIAEMAAASLQEVIDYLDNVDYRQRHGAKAGAA